MERFGNIETVMGAGSPSLTAALESIWPVNS